MKKIFTLLFVLSFGLLFSNTSKINNSKTIACPTASISYSGSPFCTNISTPQAVTLTGTDVFLGGTFTSTAGLLINAVTGAITPNMSTPGTYTITYTLISSGGCPIVTATTNVIISVAPTATIGFNQTICAGNTTTITFTGTPNATISYTINGGAVQNITLNSSGTAALPTGLLTSNTVYNLVNASSTTGCSSSISGSAVITVNPPPTIFGSPSACMGNVIQFTGSGIPAASNPWTSSNMAVATVNSTGLVTTMSPGITTITYKNNNGCTAMQTLVVHNLPIITANSSLQTICSGTNTNIALTSTIYGTTYSWNVVQTGVTGGSAGSGNSINQVLVTTGNNIGQAVYTITPTADGCAGSPITVTVQVNPIPTVTVNSPSVCSGSSATVTATPGATGSYFYAWTVPAGVPNPGNVASFITSVSGTYSVIATNAASGCASASTSGIVTVNPPAGTFNLQCGVSTPTQVYIDWSNITGITTFNYSYSINGGSIITGSQSAPSSIYITNNNQPVTFTLSGTGTVCAPTETVTCGTLNTNENSISNFVISPNPVIDLLNIKNDQTINRVTAFNQLGQVVLQKEYNTNEVQLDFSGLKTGIYFIAVDSDKKQSTFKIVKN